MSLTSGQNKPADPQEDTAVGNQKAYLLELLGQGPITGVLPGPGGSRLENVFFDQTAIQNRDGSRNFSAFKFKQRRGYADQEPLKSDVFSNTAAVYNVNAEIRQAQGPVTRTIVNSELDAVRLTFELTLYKGNGNEETGIEFEIWTKKGADPWKRRLYKEIRGLFRSAIAFEYEFTFNNQAGNIDEYQIRVERLSEDVEDEPDRVKKLVWKYYSEIIKDKIPYSGSAYTALEFDSDQFSSIPERRYFVGGIHGLIPNNMQVREADNGLDYTVVNGAGIPFNGSFYRYPSHNQCPASLLLELLTNRKINKRPLTINKIDVYSLYSLMVRNNSFLPDGRGGFHRRYAFNFQIQTREKTRDLIETICATMHAKSYFYRGKVTFWQDKPDDPVWPFTNTDVKDGKFTYSEIEYRKKYNVCKVNYYDKDNFFEPISELVDDGEAIERWRGRNQTEITVLGCDDRYRAIRAGRWAIFSSTYEDTFVSFTARAFGSLVKLGDVIEILDNKKLPYRRGGIVLSCSLDRLTIKLDSTVKIQRQSFLKCMIATGLIERKLISNPIGYSGDTITLAEPFSTVIPQEFSWMLEDAQTIPSKWRVTGIKPHTGDPTQIDITAIKYLDGKWDYIDKETPIETSTGIISTAVTVPKVLALNLTVRIDKVSVAVVWPNDALVTSAIIEYTRVDLGAWFVLGTVTRTSTTPLTPPLVAGTYRFRATTKDVKGRYSAYFYEPDTADIS